jgi:hypothetical protein
MNGLVVAKGADARVTALAMANRFKRYNPENEQIVRKADVQCDELTHLRQKREMIRSVKPEDAAFMMEFHDDMSIFEALDLAKGEGRIIVPNDVHVAIAARGRKTASGYWATWTGTFIAYEAPDVPLGDRILGGWMALIGARVEGFEIGFGVPVEFRGKTNCALVVEHPDFELVDLGGNRFEVRSLEGSVSLVEAFPAENNVYYECDARFGIPAGARSGVDTSKYLARADGAHCGFVGYGPSDMGSGISVNQMPNHKYGVALF